MNRVHLSTQLNDKGNEGEFQFSSIAFPQDNSSILLEFISGNFHEYFVKFVKKHMSQLTPVIDPQFNYNEGRFTAVNWDMFFFKNFTKYS